LDIRKTALKKRVVVVEEKNIYYKIWNKKSWKSFIINLSKTKQGVLL